MIYLTVGSSPIPFNRLIVEVDQLAGRGELHDVIAQVGSASYTPQHLKHFRFSSADEHLAALKQAEFVICHAGCATLDEALALRKKLIVAPRRAHWNEAPDDHQVRVARLLAAANMVLSAEHLSTLGQRITEIHGWTPESRSKFDPDQVAEAIGQFLESL